jgi:tetratricopeptide (TPR) repeat protein
VTSDTRLAATDVGDVDSLADLASEALTAGEEDRAIPIVRAGAERHRSALLWQWTGLLQRSLDEHESAIASFKEAARLAPTNAKIAQGLAQTTMEAGLEAVAEFEHARSLAPQNGAILVGLAAARAAAGQGELAAAELQGVLDRAPMWTYGHEQLAQLLSTLGRPGEATSSLEQAISRFPQQQTLWETLLNVQLRRGAYETLGEIVGRARAVGVHSPEFPIYEAIHAAEFDGEAYPPALFDAAPESIHFAIGTWQVRHLLRVGAVDAALPIIDQGLKGDHSAELWAYAATAWRMAADPRSEWLERDSTFVRVIDLTGALPPSEQLGATLRGLHLARGEYLDQSVRGGTQTDGPLFSRIDPTIRHLRRAVVSAVESYIEQLPPIDADHPLLRHRRDRKVRFSGSWSVRLRSGGRHSNHVHPLGWISSAFYIALPPKGANDPDDAGWLTLGEPDDKLQLDLGPWRKIEPKVGQLVLFPSWMWHGTVPFAEGERLTVAFDVRPPV